MQDTLAQTGAPVRQRILDWLAGQSQAMQDLLQTIVNIDSGSRNEAGVTAVAEALRARLQAAGVDVQFEPVPGYGVLLHAQVLGAEPGPPIVLMGHMDTVYPAGTAARRPFRVEDGRAYGPGVADMKSGLVLNVFVAEAFARCGGLKGPLHLFFSCDEEIGSPATRERIMAHVRGAKAVFNAEPGRVSGNLVTSRKGSMVVAFEVDRIDSAAHTGWSVVLLGTATALTDAEELRRVTAVGPRRWDTRHSDHYLRIRPGQFTGRRLSLSSP